MADMFSRDMCVGTLRGVTVDVSTVHDFHGSADKPSLNGTLRHQDLDLALYQRARAKVEKYRDGYAAHGLRHAFLPAIVSTSGRIHGELLRLLFNLADKKTSNSLAALGEAIDVESEVYCRRRSGNFWRMRAALGLACAQAATLGTQVVGRPRSQAQPGRTDPCVSSFSCSSAAVQALAFCSDLLITDPKHIDATTCC